MAITYCNKILISCRTCFIFKTFPSFLSVQDGWFLYGGMIILEDTVFKNEGKKGMANKRVFYKTDEHVQSTYIVVLYYCVFQSNECMEFTFILFF